MNSIAALFNVLESMDLKLPPTVPSLQDIKYAFVADNYDNAQLKISQIRDFLNTDMNHLPNIKATIQVFEMLYNLILDKSIDYAESYAKQLFQLVSQNLINANIMTERQLKQFDHKFVTVGFDSFMKALRDISKEDYKHNGATGILIGQIYENLKYVNQVKSFYL